MVLERHQTIVLGLQQGNLRVRYPWHHDIGSYPGFASFNLEAEGETQKQPKRCYKIWYRLSNTPDREGV